MNCWKCQSPLRSSEALFCPNCGAAVRSTAPSDDWKKRIEAAGSSGTGGRLAAKVLLVLLAGLLLYPVFYVRNRRRLRKHIASHLESPGFETARFEATPEGRQILAQLRRLAGNPRALGIPTAAFMYLLILVPLSILFGGPAAVPDSRISYDTVLECILDGRRAHGFVTIRSKSDFESTMASLRTRCDHAYVNYQTSTDESYRLNLPTSSWYGGPEGHWQDKPYEFLYTGGGRPTLYRATYIDYYWDGTQAMSVAFWISLALMALVLAGSHYRFWRQFNRHRVAEVLAASYLRGDLRYHDQLIADVRGRNAGVISAAIATSLPQVFYFSFPFMAPWLLREHLAWEQRNGIDRALGTPPTSTT